MLVTDRYRASTFQSNGYKLHLDTADCGVAVSALLSSASLHDSQAAIPLALMTADRVTHCYDLMDAAYCSTALRAHILIAAKCCVYYFQGIVLALDFKHYFFFLMKET
jgi:hypothetical protein